MHCRHTDDTAPSRPAAKSSNQPYLSRPYSDTMQNKPSHQQAYRKLRTADEPLQVVGGPRITAIFGLRCQLFHHGLPCKLPAGFCSCTRGHFKILLYLYCQKTPCLLVVMPVTTPLTSVPWEIILPVHSRSPKPLLLASVEAPPLPVRNHNNQSEESSGRLERVMKLLSRWMICFPEQENGTCLRFSASLYRGKFFFDAANAATTGHPDQYTRGVCIGTTSNKYTRMMSTRPKNSRDTRNYRINYSRYSMWI